MNREYHLEHLLNDAEDLRYRSYEYLQVVELNDELVLLKIYSYNHGARYYIADVWIGVWEPLDGLRWKPLHVGGSD